jgi:hypothetical protein
VHRKSQTYAWLDFRVFGGAEEDRTPDLRIANATLSQLSYGPIPVSPSDEVQTGLQQALILTP